MANYKKIKEDYLSEGGELNEGGSAKSQKIFEEVENLTAVSENKQEKPKNAFNKLDEDERTNEDIEKEVQALVEAKYGKRSSELNNTAKEKEETLNIEKEMLEKNNDKNIKEINSVYDNYIKNSEGQALKRGLARSSIIIGELNGIEKARANELVENANNYRKTLDNLEKEIAGVRASLAEDLSLLELDRASEEQELLNKKITELENTKKDIIAFNNDVEKLRRQYQSESERKKEEDAEIKENYDTRKDKYNLVLNALKQMGKTEALKELFSNEKYGEILGDDIASMYYALKYGTY